VLGSTAIFAAVDTALILKRTQEVPHPVEHPAVTAKDLEEITLHAGPHDP